MLHGYLFFWRFDDFKYYQGIRMAALTLIIFKTIKLVPFPGLKTILCISQKIPGPQIFYAGTENQFSLGIANPIRERFPFQHTGNLRIEREKYSYFYGGIIVTIQKSSRHRTESFLHHHGEVTVKLQ